MKTALLLGNGMNRIESDYSWERLIRDLLQYIEPPNVIESDGKPFPLLYEEMVQAALEVGMTESELKRYIADLVTNIKGSSLHAELRDLSLSDILTTNYDYNLEAVWKGVEPTAQESGESRYSFFRKKEYPEANIWHIHGERDLPESILLGYEHYAGYMQYMRDYANKGRDSRGAPALISRLREGISPEAHSWVDLLFNRNVYILGLTMDYVEMHLWWLFMWRARLRSISEYEIENKITYIYPRFETGNRHRLQLLKVAGIRLKRIDVRQKDDQWKRFYASALRFVKREATA